MISPYNDPDYDRETDDPDFQEYVDGIYEAIDKKLGLTGDNEVKYLIYDCIFAAWKADKYAAHRLLDDFSTDEIYLLNFNTSKLYNNWFRNN